MARSTEDNYDFGYEARRVCDATGSTNGWMTVHCALREAFDAGKAEGAREAQQQIKDLKAQLSQYQPGLTESDWCNR